MRAVDFLQQNSLKCALVIAALFTLCLSQIMGALPAAGVALFLLAILITVVCKKSYRYLILLGIVLLCCVFIEPSPSDMVFCAAIPLGLIAGVIKPRLSGRPAIVILLFMGFFLFSLPGIAAASDPGGCLRYFAITLYLFLTALLLCAYSREGNIAPVLRAYVIAALMSFLAGLIGYLGFFQNLLMADAFRIKGLFKDPNVFGPFFVPAIILVLDDIRRGKLLKIHPAAHVLLMLLMTLGVIFSFSRGAWINLAATVFVYLLLDGGLKKALQPKWLMVCLCAAAAVAVLFASPLLKDTGIKEFIFERAQLQDYDRNRFNSQQGGLALALKNPWGYGSRQFENEIARITKYKLSAHSLYVRTAVENGLPAFLLFFSAIGYMMLSLFFDHLAQKRRARLRADPPLPAMVSQSDPRARPENSFALATLSILCGLMISSLAVDTIHWRHFWFFIGIGLYCMGKKREGAAKHD